MGDPARIDLKDTKDQRLTTATCPLGCGVEMRPVRHDDHPWGERVFYQCDACGAIIELLNNTARMRFEVNTLDTWNPRLVKVADAEWAAGNYGHVMDAAAAAREAHKLELIRRTRTCKTDGCSTEFVPKEGARSEATREYCAKCRKEIPRDDVRWMDDKKRAKLKPKRGRAA